METKEIVATLKAELVGPFEFEKNNGEYRSALDANAPVKVGTLIHTESFRIKEFYTSSFTDEAGVYQNSKTEYVPMCMLHNFRSLTEAGIAIDAEEINAAYAALLPAIKEEIREAQEAKRAKRYKESWIHQGMLDIPNDPKIAKVEGLSITIGGYVPYSEDNWSHSRIHLSYRGHATYITRENDRKYGIRYIMDSAQFNNHRESRMASLTNSVMKFVNGVDTLFKLAEQKEASEKARKNAALSRAETLTEVFGLPVKAFVTEEFYSTGYGRTRHHGEYRKVSKYYVMNGETKLKEVGYYEGGNTTTYSIQGLGGLSLTQAQSIMKILVNG